MFLDNGFKSFREPNNQRKGATPAVNLCRSFGLPPAPHQCFLGKNFTERLHHFELLRWLESNWTIEEGGQASRSSGEVAHTSATQIPFVIVELEADSRLQKEKTRDVQKTETLERTSRFGQFFKSQHLRHSSTKGIFL